MGTMLFAVALIALGGLVSFLRVTAAMDEVIADPIEELRATNAVERLLYQAMMPPNDYLIHGGAAEREGFKQLASELEQAFDGILRLTSLLPVQRAALQEGRHHWRRAHDRALQIFAILEPVGDADGAALMESMDEDFDHGLLLLNQLHHHIDEEIRQLQAVVDTEKRRVGWLIAGLLAGGIGIAIVSGVVLARAIFKPLGALETGARQIGAGNLEHRLTTSMPNELRTLAESFNRMADSLQESQMALRELSVRDALTGLYNRREYERRLGQELERCHRYQTPVSLLLLDLDHFKSVNDRYGHDVGDEVLRMVARQISFELRPVDFAARFGGEEFIAILPGTAPAGALAAAERIREAVSGLVITAQSDLRVTISIGVAGAPEDASEATGLLKAADIAMYQAKVAGRNRSHRYTPPEVPLNTIP
jgi:diguanylate cyclase (GGDEF)-like protein